MPGRQVLTMRTGPRVMYKLQTPDFLTYSRSLGTVMMTAEDLLIDRGHHEDYHATLSVVTYDPETNEELPTRGG